MKTFRLFLVFVVVVVLGAVAAGWLWKQETLQQRSAHDQLELFGNADIREVELAFNGSDRITEILVEEGDRVEAGQVVGRLDTHRLKPAMQRAQARVEAQRQALARLVAGSRPEEIRRAKAAVDEAKARMLDAEQYYSEVKTSFEQNSANIREVERSQRDLDVARAAQRVASETLALVLEGPRKEDIAEARAMLLVDEADLALSRQELRDAELRSPSVGVIRDRLLEPGDMASPTRPALTLALTDPLWIRAYIDEPDLSRLRLGMEATVTTDSFPSKAYTGWVGYLSPTAEFTPKTVESHRVRTSLVYEVRVFVRNPDDELRLGMPATVTIKLQTTSPADGPESEP